MKMAGRWCCHLADQFVLLSFRHIGSYHYIHWRWPSLCRLDLERTGSVGELLVNRLRTGVGRAKTVTSRWGYLDDAQSVDCDCGKRHTIANLLSCRLLYETCTADDLATVTDQAKACARKWKKILRRKRQKKKLHPHISPCWHGPPLV